MERTSIYEASGFDRVFHPMRRAQGTSLPLAATAAPDKGAPGSLKGKRAFLFSGVFTPVRSSVDRMICETPENGPAQKGRKNFFDHLKCVFLLLAPESRQAFDNLARLFRFCLSKSFYPSVVYDFFERTLRVSWGFEASERS